MNLKEYVTSLAPSVGSARMTGSQTPQVPMGEKDPESKSNPPFKIRYPGPAPVRPQLKFDQAQFERYLGRPLQSNEENLWNSHLQLERIGTF